MAAYRRVCGFGHLRAHFRGPESAPECYARFEYWTTYATIFTFTFTYLGGRFSVAVTRWSRSTQLLYIEPG